MLFFWIPFAAGIWLRSLVARLLATLRYPARGIGALPDNWRRILWAMDSYHNTELVPGLAAHNDAFSLPGAEKDIRAGDWDNRLIGIPFLLIWFLPGLLYHWSLKSTCWLYLPLIYIGGVLRWRPRTSDEKAWLIAGLYKSRVESFRRWLAIGVVVSLVITTALNYPAFQAEIQASLSETSKFLQFSPRVLDFLEYAFLPYLWAFDSFDLAPWQWLNLLGAALTGGLWIYNGRVNRIWTLAKERDANAAPENARVIRLLFMVRLRDLCAILYVLLAFGYCVLALGGIDKELLTGWLAPLHFLYGPYL